MPVDILTAKRANIDFLLANYGYGSTTKKCKKINKFSNLLNFYE